MVYERAGEQKLNYNSIFPSPHYPESNICLHGGRSKSFQIRFLLTQAMKTTQTPDNIS